MTEQAPGATPNAAKPQSADSGPRSSRMSDFMSRYAISVVFFGLLIVLLIASPDFRDPRNLWNVLQQNSIIGIVAWACW